MSGLRRDPDMKINLSAKIWGGMIRSSPHTHCAAFNMNTLWPRRRGADIQWREGVREACQNEESEREGGIESGGRVVRVRAMDMSSESLDGTTFPRRPFGWMFAVSQPWKRGGT